MTKDEIKTEVDAILALEVSANIKETISTKVSDLIDKAVQDKYDEMKEYVDSKIAALA
jgi:hypothetical protein